MCDQDDGLAVVPQAADDLQQEFDLLGCQHGGRLIEDEDLRFPVEHLKDLYALLHGYVDLLDHLRGIHLQAELAGESQNIFIGLLQIHRGKKAQSLLHRLHAHDDILGDRVVAYQFKVLVYHTDIQFCRVVGRLNLHFLTADDDLTLVRLVHAEKHTHQSRLAGAVLPQKCVDLALFDLDGHVIIGYDPGKTLRDMIHLNNVI